MGTAGAGRYAPDGSVDRIVALPVQKPTSCMFGGPDLTTLYVTTAIWDPQRRGAGRTTARRLGAGARRRRAGSARTALQG